MASDRRGPDAAADQALRADLLSSRKDRAENIMIVDLLRNDLSHFAVPGSLRVSRLCAVESYATVHQMVSTIDAQLAPDAVRAEAVQAAFPAGSMTGAPKISTMDIIARLEKLLGRSLARHHTPSRPGDVPHTLADVGKAARLLDYAPAVTFDEGLRRTVDYFNTAGGLA